MSKIGEYQKISPQLIKRMKALKNAGIKTRIKNQMPKDIAPLKQESKEIIPTKKQKDIKGSVKLGVKVTINENVILRTCGGVIRIGNNSSIGVSCLMHGYGGITIGNDCLISPFVQMYAQNHGMRIGQLMRVQPNKKLPIFIGNDVWIGANSVITGGVTINNGVVVGAGSVVTKDIPSNEIWAGVPAKKIGERK